jgi:hypothetical protein
MGAAPQYIASERDSQKTHLPLVTLMRHFRNGTAVVENTASHRNDH